MVHHCIQDRSLSHNDLILCVAKCKVELRYSRYVAKRDGPPEVIRPIDVAL